MFPTISSHSLDLSIRSGHISLFSADGCAEFSIASGPTICDALQGVQMFSFLGGSYGFWALIESASISWPWAVLVGTCNRLAINELSKKLVCLTICGESSI